MLRTGSSNVYYDICIILDRRHWSVCGAIKKQSGGGQPKSIFFITVLYRGLKIKNIVIKNRISKSFVFELYIYIYYYNRIWNIFIKYPTPCFSIRDRCRYRWQKMINCDLTHYSYCISMTTRSTVPNHINISGIISSMRCIVHHVIILIIRMKRDCH